MRTGSPSVMFLTTSKGPVITWSPSVSPSSASKYLSPAMPVTTGMKTARPLRTTNTPSRSSRASSSDGKDLLNGGSRKSGVVSAAEAGIARTDGDGSLFVLTI